MVGRTLSHYRIIAHLGRGGMGEVYLAEDTQLGRKVAIKVLPQELAKSRERLERLEREARAVASLNHPNIVTLYSVEEAEGIRFLTMEYVEGRTLTESVPAGGLPPRAFFEVAVPLAEALAAAHEKGVIHRDLKPGNVMLTREGRVKVLDFGLAKLAQPEGTSSSQLTTEAVTGEGRVVGTVPYMSPEQIEGRPIDHRSDIFSLAAAVHGGQLAGADFLDPARHAAPGERGAAGSAGTAGRNPEPLLGQRSAAALPVGPRRAARAGGSRTAEGSLFLGHECTGARRAAARARPSRLAGGCRGRRRGRGGARRRERGRTA
jgi:serine/threonine protein kinase